MQESFNLTKNFTFTDSPCVAATPWNLLDLSTDRYSRTPQIERNAVLRAVVLATAINTRYAATEIYP